MNTDKTTENIKNVWDDRASLGDKSGSDDFILKDLEKRMIFTEIKENSTIIEVGCGNGSTLIELCKKKKCTGIGLDFSIKMIDLANQNLKKENENPDIEFYVRAAPEIGEHGLFDFALSQRCLGNLTTRRDQKKAIENIMLNLKVGGKYVMVEDCEQSHNRLNEIRKNLGLYEIDQPWFNYFLDSEEIKSWQSKKNKIIKGPIPVASTYYLLSRVVYAKIEQDRGTKPEDLKYDSDINMLAYDIPNIGELGAPSLWIWERSE